MTLHQSKQKNESNLVLKIKIKDEILLAAKKRASKIKANKYQIASGGAIYGILGEELFLNNFGGELIDCKDYDIKHKNIGKIDVKVKRCNGPPLDHYQCNVAAYQVDKNDCEFYAFYRVHNNLDTAWFLGIISKEEFVKKSIFLKKGTKTDDGFSVKADCYNIKISDLKTISEVQNNEVKPVKCRAKCKNKKVG